MLSARIALVIALLAALVLAGPAGAEIDRKQCAVAQFDKRWDRVEARETGFPESYDSHIATVSDFYTVYSDGTRVGFDDYEGQGWALTDRRIGEAYTETIFDEDFNAVGTRTYNDYYDNYSRVDPTFGIRAKAIAERARVIGLERAWQASRARVLAYSRAERDGHRRWLVRRGPAFLASARATKASLVSVINGGDVATVEAAVEQQDRFDEAVSRLDLRFPYASLFTCYR